MAEGKKSIIRMFGTDIPGEIGIRNGLRRIKGVSFASSKAILEKTGIDPEKNAGELSDKEIKNIEDVIERCDLPAYILNRRVDPEEGDGKHLVSTDLEIQHRQDIDRLKKLGSYRGMRHRRGLPVRGQRTRSSFRGKSSMGVSKKRVRKESKE